MALITCPECEKEISSTSKNCPHCGYKEKNKAMGLILLVMGISLAVVLIFGFLSLHSTKEIRSMIDDLGTITRESGTDLLKIKSELSNYNGLQQKFIFNLDDYHMAQAEFNAIPDPSSLTLENIADYVNFELSMENFSYNTSKDIFGFTHYNCTANLTVRCSAKTGGSFENTSITIEIDEMKGSGVELILLLSINEITISLNENGEGEVTKILTGDYPILPTSSFMLSSSDIIVNAVSGEFLPEA